MNKDEAQIRVLTAAHQALDIIGRYEGMLLEGRSITGPHMDDLTDSISIYNQAAAALPAGYLPLHDGTWGPDKARAEQRKVSKLLEIGDAGNLGDKIRTLVGGPSNSDGSVGRGPDPIREQLRSDERQHDYDYFESRGYDSELGGETRAISDFANGSSLFVSDFTSKVAVYQRTFSPWINLATVVTSENGRPLIVPTLTGDPTTYTPGEGTAITASDPTLGTVTLTAVGFKNLTNISYEAWEDEDVNLTDLIAKSHARAIGLAYGSAFTTTILAGVSNGGTATGAGGGGGAAGTAVSAFFGYEDLIDLRYGRAAPYRDKGVFIMANGSIKKAAKFRDGNGNYLWEQVGSGQPDAIAGGSVFEDPYLAAPASATKSVVYGDIAAALIVKATPIRVAVSSEYLFDKDQISIKTVQRIQIAVQDATAAAYLVSAST